MTIPFPTAAIIQCEVVSCHPRYSLWKNLIAARYPLTVDCWLLNENSRQAMNLSKSISTSDLSSKFNHGSLAFFFINSSHLFHFPRYTLCVLPQTDARTRDSTKSVTSALIPSLPFPVPDKSRGSGWEDERSHYTGTMLIRSCHYLPQHVVVMRSNVFGLQHYLAEAFPSRPDRLFRPVVGVCQLFHPIEYF